MTKNVFVYSLIVPRDNQVRYVGKTQELKKRLVNHVVTSKNRVTKKDLWVNELVNLGLLPRMEIIEECTSYDGYERENYWIRQFDNLTNTAKNGTNKDSFISVRLSKEEKDKLLLAASAFGVTGSNLVSIIITELSKAFEIAQLFGGNITRPN